MRVAPAHVKYDIIESSSDMHDKHLFIFFSNNHAHTYFIYRINLSFQDGTKIKVGRGLKNQIRQESPSLIKKHKNPNHRCQNQMNINRDMQKLALLKT